MSLIFREAEHGIFIAHSYQYSKDLSTFLVEVDPDSWRRAGLDTASEDDSRRYCAEVFREDLGANELLGNRSLWFEANIVRNERWSHENIVLLGDALRTVHFSLGSGTRMAMQDAIALHQGLLQHPGDARAAFAVFEAQRRPASSSFQAAAAAWTGTRTWPTRCTWTRSTSPTTTCAAPARSATTTCASATRPSLRPTRRGTR